MRFAVKPWLARIWHAPERFRLMDPLPTPHRRGIIIAALAVVIGFLWPVADESPTSTARDVPVSSAPQPPLQAELVPPPTHAATVTESAGTTPPLQDQAPVPHANNDIEQQWRGYRVKSGQTLAQLFRDHNLPPEDVYAMAQVEGENKPLSNLRSGQMVQIRQNANGVVTGLTIDNGNNNQILFTRQPNGSFLRAQ